MRITENFSTAVTAGRADKTGGAGATGPGMTHESTSGGDLVSLSGATGFVSQALSAGASGRAARIQLLAAQVQAGTYSVSADALSASIVGSLVRGY